MALYDAKIEKFSKKADQLEQNIRRDTEERKRLLSEITRLRYLSLCEKLNCQGEELETLLAREHGQIQRLKDRGIIKIGQGASALSGNACTAVIYFWLFSRPAL